MGSPEKPGRADWVNEFDLSQLQSDLITGLITKGRLSLYYRAIGDALLELFGVDQRQVKKKGGRDFLETLVGQAVGGDPRAALIISELVRYVDEIYPLSVTIVDLPDEYSITASFRNRPRRKSRQSR